MFSRLENAIAKLKQSSGLLLLWWFMTSILCQFSGRIVLCYLHF